MTWEPIRWEMRVHPTAKIEVRKFIDSPGHEWRWEVQGDTAVKFGHASTADLAKADALTWWNQFCKTMDAAFKPALSASEG